MEIKKLKSSMIISLILSIFAFIFNIFTFYIFLFISAFSSIGDNYIQYILSKSTVIFNVGLIALMFMIFIFSIILIKKINSYEKQIKPFPKKMVITLIVLQILSTILNLLIGVFNIVSYIGWLFIFVTIIFLILAIVELHYLKILKKRPMEIENNN